MTLADLAYYSLRDARLGEMKRENDGRALGLGVPLAVALTGMVACRPPRPLSPAPGTSAAATPSPTPPGALAPPVASPQPEAGRPHNTLRWKTNDVSNFGYDIYRAEREDGPFVKVNAQPVPGTLKPGKVQTFEYQDTAIDPGRDYWYYVESISLTGERMKFTPTLKAPAKVPPPTPRD